MKRTRLSPEEREIRDIEKHNRKVDREEKKKKKESLRKEKLKKKERTEADIVRSYANRVIANQRNHGRVNTDKFKGIQGKQAENKNLWLDTDFYFSVVFQSARQKYEFLEKLNFDVEVDSSIKCFRILNGVKFAELLGIKLEINEKKSEYPTCDIALKDFVLDNEIL